MGVAERVGEGWRRHADDPEGVAAEVEALAAEAGPDEVPQVLGLGIHVLCEHLDRPDRAGRLLDVVARHGELPAIVRSRAVLRLAGGDEGALSTLVAFGEERRSSEARVLASAAALRLARHDTTTAWDLLARAWSVCRELPDPDPGVRVVAMNANNLACELEKLQGRTVADDAVLRTAAALARAAWERAGTWLEVERAEYRLAKTHLALGDPQTALIHADACLASCRAHGAEASELAYAEAIVAEVKAAEAVAGR